MKQKLAKFLEVFNVLSNVGLIGAAFFLCYKIEVFSFAKRLLVRNRSRVSIDLIGCGNYALSRHIPILTKRKIKLGTITTKSGLAARNLDLCTNKLGLGLSEYLLICSPHYLHPLHLTENINKYQKIYCEKPVCIDLNGLDILKRYLREFPDADRKVTVGFNRRNAPAIREIVTMLSDTLGQIELTYRVNFGPRILNDMSNTKVGGGRLIGACCHYVDLIEHIIGSKLLSVYARPLSQDDHDTFTSILSFSNGSIASLIFSSEGDRPRVGKEQISVTTNGLSIDLFDFQRLIINNKVRRYRFAFDGSMETWDQFISRPDYSSQISLSDGIHATEVTLAIQESLKKNEEVLFT